MPRVARQRIDYLSPEALKSYRDNPRPGRGHGHERADLVAGEGVRKVEAMAPIVKDLKDEDLTDAVGALRQAAGQAQR